MRGPTEATLGAVDAQLRTFSFFASFRMIWHFPHFLHNFNFPHHAICIIYIIKQIYSFVEFRQFGTMVNDFDDLVQSSMNLNCYFKDLDILPLRHLMILRFGSFCQSFFVSFDILGEGN